MSLCVQAVPGTLSYFGNADARVLSFQNIENELLKRRRRLAIDWEVRTGEDQLQQPLVIGIVERQLTYHLQRHAIHACLCSQSQRLILARLYGQGTRYFVRQMECCNENINSTHVIAYTRI